MNLQELKNKVTDLISQAENWGLKIEHIRKQEILFAILKTS